MLDPNVERKLRRGRVAQRSDITILDCEVEGKIPPELNGAFVRVGGEWFYPPRFADDAPLKTFLTLVREVSARISTDAVYSVPERPFSVA